MSAQLLQFYNTIHTLDSRFFMSGTFNSRFMSCVHYGTLQTNFRPYASHSKFEDRMTMTTTVTMIAKVQDHDVLLLT